MEILVIHPGALGDIILSLPSLRILRDADTGTRITLAANVDFARAVAAGFAERILPLSSFPLHRLFLSEPPVADRAFWREYDRIICWTGSGNETFCRNFTHIHPEVLVRGWKPGPEEIRHVARLFADGVLPPCSDHEPDLRIRIHIDPEVAHIGMGWLHARGWTGHRPLLAWHCGAGSAQKRWPAQRVIEASAVLSRHWDLLFMEGPAEPGLTRGFGIGGPGTFIAENLPLPELAAVMAHAGLYLGNDSGISHLAAGLQLPCIVLFGPSNPAHWAPVGAHVRVLKSQEYCAACGGEADMPHTCMAAIPASAVLHSVEKTVSSGL